MILGFAYEIETTQLCFVPCSMCYCWWCRVKL